MRGLKQRAADGTEKRAPRKDAVPPIAAGEGMRVLEAAVAAAALRRHEEWKDRCWSWNWMNFRSRRNRRCGPLAKVSRKEIMAARDHASHPRRVVERPCRCRMIRRSCRTQAAALPAGYVHQRCFAPPARQPRHIPPVPVRRQASLRQRRRKKPTQIVGDSLTRSYPGKRAISTLKFPDCIDAIIAPFLTFFVLFANPCRKLRQIINLRV